MSRTAVVETVTGRTTAELRAARDAACGPIVELRLDGVSDPDVAAVLEGRRVPVIVTCRPMWEGGRFEGSEQDRLALLGAAIRLGAEFVDVEWRADRRLLPPAGDRTRLILSSHDFTGMPADLAAEVRAMAAERSGIVKVAVTPASLRDCVTLRDAMRMDEPHVAIAMGSAGQLTRLLPWVFGSCLTYGGSAAPGQVPASELIDVYRVSERTSATAIYGVAGMPLAHSASPAMHNAAFTALGLDAVYVPFETGRAEDLLEVGAQFGLAGGSITAPLKTRVFDLVNDVDELSGRIGAINTIRRRDEGGGWEGRNFDVAGFLAPFDRRGRALTGAHAVVLGAGGAARTAIWALQSRGAHVEIAARRVPEAEALALEFHTTTAPWPPPAGWDLLVNTTPVGTWPETGRSPLDREFVKGRTVYDLIYNPEETALLAMARANGAEPIGGLEMLVGQARLQFEWWTGREAPEEIMAAAARRFLARAQGHA